MSGGPHIYVTYYREKYEAQLAESEISDRISGLMTKIYPDGDHTTLWTLHCSRPNRLSEEDFDEQIHNVGLHYRGHVPRLFLHS